MKSTIFLHAWAIILLFVTVLSNYCFDRNVYLRSFVKKVSWLLLLCLAYLLELWYMFIYSYTGYHIYVCLSDYVTILHEWYTTSHRICYLRIQNKSCFNILMLVLITLHSSCFRIYWDYAIWTILWYSTLDIKMIITDEEVQWLVEL